MYGRTWLVAELIRRGADPDIQDKNGITALHEAARLCRLDICRTLLAAGASPDTADKNGKFPSEMTSQFVNKGRFEEYFAPYRVNLTLDHVRYLKNRPAVLELFRVHESRP